MAQNTEGAGSSVMAVQPLMLNDKDIIQTAHGKFVWKKIGDYNIPVIMREGLGYFVSTRMAQNVIKMYLKLFHKDVFNVCFNIDSYYISKSEAVLLTYINETYCKELYGKEVFQEGKDYITSLADVQELYAFCDKFFKKLTSQDSSCESNCGFLIFFKLSLRDSGMAVPFCVQDGQTYVPVSFIDIELDIFKNVKQVQLSKWNASYLKMCYLTMRIDKEPMYDDDNFFGISATDIKRCLNLQSPLALWIDTDHMIQDLRRSNDPEISPDIWFNKPGQRIRRPLNSTTWKTSNLDPPHGVALPMKAENAPGFKAGLNIVLNNTMPPQ